MCLADDDDSDDDAEGTVALQLISKKDDWDYDPAMADPTSDTFQNTEETICNEVRYHYRTGSMSIQPTGNLCNLNRIIGLCFVEI